MIWSSNPSPAKKVDGEYCSQTRLRRTTQLFVLSSSQVQLFFAISQSNRRLTVAAKHMSYAFRAVVGVILHTDTATAPTGSLSALSICPVRHTPRR